MKTIFTFCLSILAFSIPGFAQIDFELDNGIIEDAVAEKIWDGSFAAGLNGKSGNSENMDINLNLNLTRNVNLVTTKLQASYFYASNDIVTTTDRFFGLGRHEVGFASHPKLSCFVQATIEDDRFKSYDYLLGLHTGLVYKVYDNDNGFLKLRGGAGASRQGGGLNDEWVPELQFGADWERQLSKSSKVFASFDYFPSVEDFADYRSITNAGFDFVVDDELNLNFRLFVLSRYDSTPEPGDQENDLDYGVAIVYGF